MVFTKRVSTTKRNHIYFGPTESNKIAVTLEEINVDIKNVYGQFDAQLDSFDAIASGYLDPSGRLAEMRSFVSEMENTFEKSLYIRATQSELF